jgi:hypothetical protein
VSLAQLAETPHYIFRELIFEYRSFHLFTLKYPKINNRHNQRKKKQKYPHNHNIKNISLTKKKACVCSSHHNNSELHLPDENNYSC